MRQHSLMPDASVVHATLVATPWGLSSFAAKTVGFGQALLAKSAT